MILTQDTNDATFQIRAYRPGLVTINDHTYQNSLIIATQQLIPGWRPQSCAEIKPEDWQAVLDLNPELILLGTGKTFQMPHHSQLAAVYAKKIGIECMNTGAACRTYMALSAEGRRVAAALLLLSV